MAVASERTPVSNLLGVNNPKLLRFWCLYFLKENIHYIPEFDILVLYERKDNLLTILDIVGKNIPPFDDIYPFISAPSDRAVEFLFLTDRLNLGRSIEYIPFTSNGTHLLGDVPFENDRFLFPITSRA